MKITVFSHIGFIEKLIFTKHLAVMIKSGIPITEGISIIIEQTQNMEFKKLLGNVLKDIDNGQSLEKALSKHNKVFDGLYTNLIKIGEESGTLDENLAYLAEQLKKSYEFRKKILGALLYPAIIFIAALVVGVSISFFVFPQLIKLFESLDVKLPPTTQALLAFAYVMQNYGIYIGAGILILLIILKLIIRIPAVNYRWHILQLALPIIGPFIQNIHLATITRNLGIMLKSGLPIVSALQTLHEATNNLVYRKYIEQMIKGLDKGKSLSEELKGAHFPYMPLIVVKMIEVGEKSGDLDENLLYLASFFEDDVDNYSKNFATIIEPVILLVIGLLVAFLALAIISPIYELTSGIKR